MFATIGDKNSSGISNRMAGARWDLNPQAKTGLYAFIDVSDFADSKCLIGQPVVLVPDATYKVKAIPAGTNVAKSSMIGVFLGYGEGIKPVLGKLKTDAEADGVYAIQISGEVDQARVTESSGFVATNFLQLVATGTAFVKSGATNAFEIEVIGVATDDCSGTTDVVLHKVVLSPDPVHAIPAT